MQLAMADLPDPGDPLNKNPRLGGSLLISLTFSSFRMTLNIYYLIFFRISAIPPRF
jgi:hypothetical protein